MNVSDVLKYFPNAFDDDLHWRVFFSFVLKVDFDKSKHLADSTIKKRGNEREKLIEKERDKEESERRRKELEDMKRQQEL